MKYLLFSLSMIFCSCKVLAAIDTYQFKDDIHERQFRQLIQQLRCPKCQNSSIADSDSMIASDMREKVYILLQQGQSKQEVIDYMVMRYGNFITYQPPITLSTLILWLLPILFLTSSTIVIVMHGRRCRTSLIEKLNKQDLQRLQILLGEKRKP
ncbi:cytochrome c-type biogenesis protein CcmH [Photorhabdus luminescens]|uniref:cytochrome c-type biogenesis protein n=1 Tax=Photorhabdus akhurstii TaxID=171438 RepID=UPI000CF92B4B|nr:cytochrome c-type biogenesis protein CcmH [Photorhabdus luminescens]PQQ27531.1 cytochrome c-type biogenesis protein CcmH [Photorhabdus luminescens]